MDKSFSQMSALLHAVWPAVSALDWSQYCGQRVALYDDFGVPKYTGLLMHRSGGGCVGASTVVTGFLPRPEKSAAIVVSKTDLLMKHSDIMASMERRNPKENLWGGGVRSSENPEVCYAITMLPEIGDQTLIAQMMRECGLLTKADWQDVTDPETDHMTAAREYVEMPGNAYNLLKKRIFDIVNNAMPGVRAAA